MSKTKKDFMIVIIISIAIICTVLVLGTVMELGNKREYTIIDVDIQMEFSASANKSAKTKYLYFCQTANGEMIVFENEDSLVNGKFNSSDILAKIKSFEKSETRFKIITRGYRIPFLTMYQNIISVETIKE